MLVTVTVTPGMTAPLLSVTVPKIVPVTAWAMDGPGQQEQGKGESGREDAHWAGSSRGVAIRTSDLLRK